MAQQIITMAQKDITHGFNVFVKYFLEGKEKISQIEKVVLSQFSAGQKTTFFDDQYITLIGGLYYLILGKYNLLADLRSLIVGDALCAHPYDICTKLIFEETNLPITNLNGQPFNAPMKANIKVGFFAYANPAIRKLIEPVLLEQIKKIR